MIPPLPQLAPGDRAPNFLLPGADGYLWVFYERVRGYRTILILAPQPDDARALLADFAERRDRLEDLQVDVFAVIGGDAAQARRLGEELALPFMLFADPKQEMLRGYAGALGRPEGRAVCLLLDANQRLLQTVAPADAGAGQSAADAALAFYAADPPQPGRLVHHAAPVLILPNVLDRGLCQALIARWHDQGHEEGMAQARDARGRDILQVEHSVKKRRDHRIADWELSQQLANLIGRRIAPDLGKAYLLPSFRFDAFIVTCYDAERGDYFRPHRDNTTQETQDRLFALTLNLNTEDYEGGGLRFPEYGPTLYAPPTGGAILFSCSLVHEATPPTRGRRFTLLSFLRDPNPKGQANPLGVWGRGAPARAG
jgi:predicted 2-oxoglutarate/Fe(II)-dependent dioxygenase YbiX/peroxiredoxin